jgi:hypothetical protein
LTLNKNLSFSLDYEYNRVEIGDQTFEAHLGKVRLKSALNKALSINAFVQYSGADEDLGANIRLRFNPREGTDFFLVFNEAINTSLNPEEPRLPRQPRSQARAILLKYTYTFVK